MENRTPFCIDRFGTCEPHEKCYCHLPDEIEGDKEIILFERFKWEMITVLVVILLAIILSKWI